MKTKLKKAATAATEKEEKRFDLYQSVTDAILAHLEKGTVPWRRPWDNRVGRPVNLASGHAYQGINVLLLGLRGFASPHWLTLRQANDLGAQVRKGERGTLIVKAGKHEQRRKGEEDKVRTTYYLRGYTVFNALQIDGLNVQPEAERPELPGEERIAAAERIVSAMKTKPAINEGRTVRASYNLPTDTVDMPERSRFESAERFHMVLFHELIHSTGHESRLNRASLVGATSSVMTEYSKEELVAEMGAAFLGMEAGIVDDGHEQSSAYIQSWLKTLQEPGRKRWIVEAGSQAAKAARFVLGIQ